MVKKINAKFSKALRIAGEVISQALNVPILSGAMIAFIFFRLPTHIPNRISGFSLTLVFLCLIPLGSLFFYIPGKLRDWPKVIKRQRIASFVFMIVSYPIGFVVLRLTDAPKIYEAVAATYTRTGGRHGLHLRIDRHAVAGIAPHRHAGAPLRQGA